MLASYSPQQGTAVVASGEAHWVVKEEDIFSNLFNFIPYITYAKKKKKEMKKKKLNK